MEHSGALIDWESILATVESLSPLSHTFVKSCNEQRLPTWSSGNLSCVADADEAGDECIQVPPNDCLLFHPFLLSDSNLKKLSLFKCLFLLGVIGFDDDANCR